MAEIFLAQRRSFGGFRRFVVIKRLLAEHRGQPLYEQLFVEEARIVGTLDHPHIVSTYDLGKFDDAFFIVMEYIHGVSGAELLTHAARLEGAVEYGAAVTICSAIAKALDHGYRGSSFYHDQLGVVHHDVSPHNLQIGYDGSVKLLDYGVATQTGNSSPRGRRGKYAYMTPEVINQQEADHRSDLFSLMVILYEFTVGRRLFKAKSPKETMARIREGRVPSPTSVIPDYPKALEAILLKGLSVDPNHRYQTGEALATALSEVAETANFMTGPRALAGYMRSLFFTEIEASRRHLEETLATVDQDDATQWTSSHSLVGSGGFDALDPEQGSELAAPSGRETIELPEAGIAALTGSIPPQPQLPSIPRVESLPVNHLTSGMMADLELPPGVNDTDQDWAVESSAHQHKGSSPLIVALSCAVLGLVAALAWALTR